MSRGKKGRVSLEKLLSRGGIELGLKYGMCFRKSRWLEEDSGQREGMLGNHQHFAMTQVQVREKARW